MLYSWICLSLIVSLAVATSGCYLNGKQDEVNQIHVIHLPPSEEDNLSENDPEIIEIHIPSDTDRRKREVYSGEMEKTCTTNADCPEGWRCDELLICRPANTPEDGPEEPPEDTKENENLFKQVSPPSRSIIIFKINYDS